MIYSLINLEKKISRAPAIFSALCEILECVWQHNFSTKYTPIICDDDCHYNLIPGYLHSYSSSLFSSYSLYFLAEQPLCHSCLLILSFQGLCTSAAFCLDCSSPNIRRFAPSLYWILCSNISPWGLFWSFYLK